MKRYQLDENTVHVYSMTGEHLYRLPYTACQFTESMKAPGSMSVSVDFSKQAQRLQLWKTLHPWKCMIALQNGEWVRHAGPVTDIQWDAGNRQLQITAGGGLTLLTKRLVLKSDLNRGWRDGTVIVDEKHPAKNMVMEWRRTWWWVCIVRLIQETKKWGDLPIDLPTIQEPGDKQRTYYSWDLATVADRISDIMNLEGGNECIFEPYLTEDGRLRFNLVIGKPYIVYTRHQWNAIVPGQRVKLTSISSSGTNLCTQVWATGGKDSDKTLMCRKTATPKDGYLLMQAANTSHTTVTRLATLQQHAKAQLSAGYYPTESFTLEVGEEHAVTVGDEADLRVNDDYLGNQLLKLRITDIQGDTNSDWLTLTAVERG